MTMQKARRNPTSTPRRSRPLWHVTEAEIERAIGPAIRGTANTPRVRMDHPSVRRIRSAGAALARLARIGGGG
jgi:hypothetical protein